MNQSSFLSYDIVNLGTFFSLSNLTYNQALKLLKFLKISALEVTYFF